MVFLIFSLILKIFFLTSCSVTLDAFLLKSLLTSCQWEAGSHLAFFSSVLFCSIEIDNTHKRRGKKKPSHCTNMCILGDFLSCQVARIKPQEDAKMLSNPWNEKWTKVSYPLGSKRVQKIMHFFPSK